MFNENYYVIDYLGLLICITDNFCVFLQVYKILIMYNLCISQFYFFLETLFLVVKLLRSLHTYLKTKENRNSIQVFLKLCFYWNLRSINKKTQYPKVLPMTWFSRVTVFGTGRPIIRTKLKMILSTFKWFGELLNFGISRFLQFCSIKP